MWNALIYANADGGTAEAGIRRALSDIAAIKLGEHDNVAVQFNTKIARELHWFTHAGHATQSFSPVDTTCSESLTAFIDDATRYLGRQATLLIMCAHGAALDSVAATFEAIRKHNELLPGDLDKALQLTMDWGPDPVTGKTLPNTSIRQAIENSEIERVDILALNSCWMGTLELAYELRDAATVVVASQVKAEVWPYGDLFSRLVSATNRSDHAVAALVVDSVRAGILSGVRYDAVAAIRTNRLDKLFDSVNKFAIEAAKILPVHWGTIHGALEYGPHGVDNTLVCDLQMITIVAAGAARTAQDAAARVLENLAKARIDYTAGARFPGTSGISIFCPTTDHDIDEVYSGLEFSSNAWAKFLEEFQKLRASTRRSPDALLQHIQERAAEA